MADAIRVLAMDAVQKANSGHPGMPMGMADVATVLASSFLKFNPEDPTWQDRDRLILSAGHGSMLLYALNYLTGYKKMPLDQIKSFRQLDSICDGHPEYNPEAGIEMTTGPLGQGLATAVGMALAEQLHHARLSDRLVDHYTYVIAGDGCLMEGISQEAISLAGHLGLGKLIVLFDDNQITIDGSTSLSTSDDTKQRFEASKWHVQQIDGHDHQEIFEAITKAKDNQDHPSLICCRTKIAYGSPHKQGTSDAHGAPLGEDEVQFTRQNLGWSYPPFDIPESILQDWRRVWVKNEDSYDEWQTHFKNAAPDVQNQLCAHTYSRVADEDNNQSKGAKNETSPNSFVEGFEESMEALFTLIKELTKEKPKLATRKASGLVLEQLKKHRQDLIGGSADLSGSNNTKTSHSDDILPGFFKGNYINYGVREHAMAAMMNGIALHGGFLPYGGTFLVFSDYARPAIRLSALMKQHVIYVMTHDSIGLGEDGPTHQPIEHLASLRAMPGLQVFRPCDAVETVECWMTALEDSTRPSLLALSRQSTPTSRHVFAYGENLSSHGGYVMRAEPDQKESQYCIVATGTEVEIAIAIQKELESEKIFGRVVSMPCVERFLAQDTAYQQKTLCSSHTSSRQQSAHQKSAQDVHEPHIFVIEAASSFGWQRIASSKDHIFSLDSFGASAPAKDLYKHFGLTAPLLADLIRKRLTLSNDK